MPNTDAQTGGEVAVLLAGHMITGAHRKGGQLSLFRACV